MPYYYLSASREADPHALADVEVFENKAFTCSMCNEVHFHDPVTGLPSVAPELPRCARCGGDQMEKESGFWYAYCSDGCLWDSDPCGPFDSEAEALAAAREAAGYCPHGIAEDGDDVCEECPAPELWVLRSPQHGTYFARDHFIPEPICILGTMKVKHQASCWSTREAAQAAADRNENLSGLEPYRLPDADARRWGRS